MFSLDGKTALVTGATGGIGGAIARALHAQGATVTISGTRQEKLDELMSQMPAMKKPTISHLYGEDWVAVEIIVEETTVRNLIPLLKRAGAQDIIEYPLNKVIY